jgi:hypothetical protein
MGKSERLLHGKYLGAKTHFDNKKTASLFEKQESKECFRSFVVYEKELLQRMKKYKEGLLNLYILLYFLKIPSLILVHPASFFVRKDAGVLMKQIRSLIPLREAISSLIQSFPPA